DKIMGDGFMALFNAPTTQIDHANRAVRSAMAMRRRTIEWNAGRRHKLAVRIGIHTGDAVVGNIGTSMLMNYTAIGDTVNLAKRIEEACEDDQILLTVDTYRRLDLKHSDMQDLAIEPRGTRQLKGRTASMEVYSVEETPQLANA
ncbi:MAG: adenylate/guanylate cyclase domain-containing protein, partial [Caldilinea sp.]|nr:adenylate/guanylate cyclase domain-containing protein [Caldilinea sp.]